MKSNFLTFPTVNPAKGNIYHRCRYCKLTEPAINYRLEGHAKHCQWAALASALLDDKEFLYVPDWAKEEFRYLVDGKEYIFDHAVELGSVFTALGLAAEYANIFYEGYHNRE
jgi:hypothetical protein